MLWKRKQLVNPVRCRVKDGGRIAATGMILALSILAALLAIPGCTRVVIVNFPDPALDLAIREEIGKQWGSIYNTDLSQLTRLDLSFWNINTLDGIEYCVNLTELYLSKNRIVHIDALSKLRKLIALGLNGNQIIDISPLSRLTNLKYLGLTGNRISDISALSRLKQLETLLLDENLIIDISPLSRLTKLTHLYLSDNAIVDIQPLSRLTNLADLVLDENPIDDIQALVDNVGFGEGDTISIYNRSVSIDVSRDSPDILNIEILRNRGVEVRY